MNPVQRSKGTARKWWLAIHLYLGLSLGLLIAILGITGSLLVFYLDLDEMLNPELIATEVGSEKLPYQALFEAIRETEPNRQRGWRLEIPADPERMVTARYYKPLETEHKGFAPLMLSVNPYTGQVVKNRFWGDYAMTWIYDLHYTLLLGEIGKISLAVVGVFLLLSLISGVYLWWPAPGKYLSALTIKRRASVVRLNYDLHKVAGTYSLVALLVLALTGAALEIPDYVNPVIAYFSPLKHKTIPKSSPLEGNQPTITLDQAVMIAQQHFPHTELAWIETPHGPEGSYRINLYQNGEPSRRFPKTNVWIDPYSGAVLQISDPFQMSAGNILIHWLHPLHSGEALALPGRLFVFVAGLSCPVLFVTGLIRWLQKRRASRLKRIK
jgi:uncharacterized iron-regulated membrane protein